MPLIYKKGDLLSSGTDLIAHQCNCSSLRGLGLSAAMFRKYPCANTYNKTSVRVPGTISVHEDRIVNMYGQKFPGKPKSKSGDDCSETRKHFFQKCLDDISTIIEEKTIAFPKFIGCGLAGGNWTDYEKMLETFEKKHPGQVYIVFL